MINAHGSKGAAGPHAARTPESSGVVWLVCEQQQRKLLVGVKVFAVIEERAVAWGVMDQ